MKVFGGRIQAKVAEEELKASIVPIDPIDGIEAANVQDALAAINAKIPASSESGGLQIDMSQAVYVPKV